jgi:NADPH2:quinone reductase
MRIQAIRFSTGGSPAEVLRLEEVDLPAPGPGEVRVRMLKAPVNPSDLLFIRGKYAISPHLPATPGFEGVGVVEAIGSGLLPRLLSGRRVAVLGSLTGTWASHTIVSARQVVPVSSRLSDEQAAMFFVNPATAWLLTRVVLNLRPGETLVQSAAASSVGRMVIRLGQRYGFDTVNIVRREEQADSLRAIGAQRVLVSDGPGLSIQVRTLLPEGVLKAIDPVGGVVASELASSLGERGELVLYGTLSDAPLSISPRDLLTVGATLRGFWLGQWMKGQSLLGKLRIVRNVSRLVADGTLATVPGPQFLLSRIAEAVTAAEQTNRAGKVLLRCGETTA